VCEFAPGPGVGRGKLHGGGKPRDDEGRVENLRVVAPNDRVAAPRDPCANAVVLQDVPANATAVRVPARILPHSAPLGPVAADDD